ncbi:unnamed protein product [Schistocephalus solidus]|uniref:Uncharacterized protein n=1 Tax=Schistocephalus solidus TaxID=70667 RepID=A0A183S7E1_SCHSO|nr:unnamed protein product [Schistocephalus solidus]
MLLRPPLVGTQLSPMAPRIWVLPSGHTPGDRHDRRAKPDLDRLLDPSQEATAHSPHASAWSVTCESTVQSLVNQCLELKHTAELAASTALTVLAHSLIAWAYSVTCSSMTAEFTVMPKTPIPHAHPPLLPFLEPLTPPLPRMTSPSLSRFLLPTLRPKPQLTHRPGRSLVNPLHGGW